MKALVILVLLIGGLAFYWYEWRPAEIMLFAWQSKAEHNPNLGRRFRLESREGNDGLFKIPGWPFDGTVGLSMDAREDGEFFAGLGPFAKGTLLTIGDGGTLLVDEEDIIVKDKNGKKWVSRTVKLDGKKAIVFLPGK